MSREVFPTKLGAVCPQMSSDQNPCGLMGILMACYNFLWVVFHPQQKTQPNRGFEHQLLLSGHVSEAPSGASSSQLERGPGKHIAPTRFLRPGNHGVQKPGLEKR